MMNFPYRKPKSSSPERNAYDAKLTVRFAKELDFFKKNQGHLFEEYGGKILVIRGQTILGAYNTKIEAFSECVKNGWIGSCMIQLCGSGADVYTTIISTPDILV